jgi:hypothetical protein
MFSKVICRFILLITGWQEPSLIYPVKGKCVAIYPHSSYWDFIFISLYLIAYPEVFLGNVKILMTERFSWLFFFMNHLVSAPDRYVRFFIQKGFSKPRAIAETFKYMFLSLFSKHFSLSKVCDAASVSCSTVDCIAEQLINTPNFIFLISPSGSISAKAWKSGYKIIAKKLNVDILVGGISYSKKTLVTTFRYNIHSTDAFDEDLDLQLIPYFDSIGTIKSETVIDYPTMTSFIGSCVVVPLLFKISVLCGLVGVCTSVISLYYHSTTETCFHILDLYSSIFASYMIFCVAHFSVEFMTMFNCLLFSGATFFLGRSWHCNRPRRLDYHINHSLFHIFSSMACYLLLTDVIEYYEF